MGCWRRGKISFPFTNLLSWSNWNLDISPSSSNAAFLLYDITRSSTLDNLIEWTSIVRQKGGPIPIKLVGSKSDLANNLREIPIEHGVQIAEKNDFTDFTEISAKNNTKVDQVFLDLIKIVIQDIDQ